MINKDYKSDHDLNCETLIDYISQRRLVSGAAIVLHI